MFKVHGPTTSSQFDVLAGAKECLDAPETCDLSKGIAIDETTGRITFTLTEPDPELPSSSASRWRPSCPPTPRRPTSART